MAGSTKPLVKSDLFTTASIPLNQIFSFFSFNEVDTIKTVNRYWLSQSQTWLKTILTTPIAELNVKQNLFGILFVTSNEIDIEETFERLAKMEKISNGVHLGVSALHNWDYAVAMRSRYVILLDHSPVVSCFNEKAIEILRISYSQTEFQEKLLKELAHPAYGYIFNQLYKDTRNSQENARFEITTWMQKPYSALHTDDGFCYMQKLARKNSIITVTCSLQETDKLEKVARAVKRAGLRFSSIYLSNAYDYISANELQDSDPLQQRQFKRSIALLKEDLTCIIDATSYTDVRGIVQKIVHGREYSQAI